MKITKITPRAVDRHLFVEIETDAGITGTGECGAWGHFEAAAGAIRKFADYLVGRDPGEIEKHWGVMHRFGHFHGAAIGGAISAIDIALWDIKGQALGAPIHALLGGPVRDSARVYAHVKAPTRETMIAAAKTRVEQGYTAIGHLNPFLDEDRDAEYFKSHARAMDDAVSIVADLRDAVGNDIDLCIEIHRRLSPAEAITFAQEIAPYRPMFYEDPIAPTTAEAMARVARSVPVPIATGERFFSLQQFQAHLQCAAMEYARVSVCLCGGITGARKIAALAEAFDVKVIPHNPLSPISLMACLHLDAAIPNFAIQELPLTTLSNGGTGHTNQLRGADLVDWKPSITDGFIEIPKAPGLGGKLSGAAAKAGQVAREIRMRPHRDGSYIDQ